MLTIKKIIYIVSYNKWNLKLYFQIGPQVEDH